MRDLGAIQNTEIDHVYNPDPENPSYLVTQAENTFLGTGEHDYNSPSLTKLVDMSWRRTRCILYAK